MCADSKTYIDMDFAREPIYSLYLAFFRAIIPLKGEVYLEVAILGQSVLAAIAAFCLANYLVKELTLPKWLGFCILAVPLATSLLCRLAAQRGAMYSNSILTEGLTISLYLLFIRFGYEYYLHRTKKSFLACTLLCTIGILTRKQMAVLIALFLLIIFVTNVCSANKKYYFRKAFLITILTAVGIFSFVALFDRGYNYILRGEFTKHTQDNRFIATMIFYTAEREYGELIADPQAREIFYKVYDACEEKNYLMHSAPEGWFEEVSHFEDNYDFIQLDTLSVILWDYLDPYYADYDREYRELQFDRINSTIINSLLLQEFPDIAHVLLNNLLAGLVTTVARRTPLLTIYSAIMYICYIVLLVYLLFEYQKQNKNTFLKSILAFAILVLISILGNVTLVSAVIFCQTRYTIYNMPLFYIAGMLMLYGAFQTKFHIMAHNKEM